MSDASCDLTVVIGFKDWGLTRLALAVESVCGSFGDARGEVIVSDYGSADPEGNRLCVEKAGGRYVFTPTDGTWSRSRALNAGFAHSRGAVLVSTDADMLFSPGSLGAVAAMVRDDPSLALLLQCRDLPEGYSHDELQVAGADWDDLEAVSRLRPRWGMGGMMAVTREAYTRVRGFDERMRTYGGEDIDFAYRIKRAGGRLVWVDDPQVRMYHMWHPPTRAAIKDPAAEADIAANRAIVYEDKSFVRNVPVWEHPLPDSPPLVSVAIATHNRCGYLEQAILSVLAQTLQDFEIVVVDDGSTDGTRALVGSFDDPRIRYVFQEQQGIAAARNRAADVSRGRYTAVLDDDDIMPPWRLEKHFEHLEEGTHGSFGSFVNFDDASGEMKLYASKQLNAGTILESGGAPGHGTWLVETDVVRRLRYDETLSSGVDNNLALRMVRAGVRLVHSGEVMLLRRMHPGQVTVTDSSAQSTSAAVTRALFSFSTTKWGADKLAEQRGKDDYVPVRGARELDQLVLPYLPDHLVHREVQVVHQVGRGSAPGRAELPAFAVRELAADGAVLQVHGVKRGATWEDLVDLRRSGASVSLSASLRSATDAFEHASDAPDLSSALRRAIDVSSRTFATSLWAHDRSKVVAVVLLDATAVDALPVSTDPVERRRFETTEGGQDVVFAACDGLASAFDVWSTVGEVTVLRLSSHVLSATDVADLDAGEVAAP